nr:protein kinase-like domain, concanavalin A-like lectin/glucanase domain protein [Tanacetum cinerariifolium]
MISKLNLLWKTVSKNLDDAPTRNTAGSLTAQMNFTSTNYHTKEELRGKVIKSRSKFLSLKYLSESSFAELSKNPSSSKRVHFINSIIILDKEDEVKEEGSVKSSATEYKNHKVTVKDEEKVESKEEVEEETKEEEEGNLEHFDTFPTMNELRLEPRRKPSNPKKNYNFVRRVRGLKVFVGNFTYECDFMVLEDTTNVIDHYLGSVVFRKPFVEATGLVYNKEEGTIVFERDKENIIFKMPHKIATFKHIDFTDISTDRIPPFVIKSDGDNCEKPTTQTF